MSLLHGKAAAFTASIKSMNIFNASDSLLAVPTRRKRLFHEFEPILLHVAYLRIILVSFLLASHSSQVQKVMVMHMTRAIADEKTSGKHSRCKDTSATFEFYINT